MSTESFRPEFTIITVTLNSENSLQRCFNSLRAQKFRDFEYIVVDGASQDSTLQIIESNLDLVDVLISEVDSGLYDAMNKGISRARGRFVGILNSDDEFLPETLLLVKEHLESNPGIQVIYGDLFMGESMLDKLVVPFDEVSTRMIPHPTVFVSLETYQNHGIFDTSYQVAADYELMLRLDSVGARFCKLDAPLAVMHPGGYSAKHRLRSIIETCYLQMKFRNTHFAIAMVGALHFFLASYIPHKGRSK
jgi:glycosyltransferase involved in cell wall biosynthesis